MVKISAKQARMGFSKLLKEAGKGQTIAIMHRGRAVAKIGPMEESPRGCLPDLSEFRKSLLSGGKTLSRIVLEQRRSSRY